MTITYTLEDGTTAVPGERIFNYYDRYPVTITPLIRVDPTPMDAEWFDTTLDDGTRGPCLNGERCCSMATARRKGWI